MHQIFSTNSEFTNQVNSFIDINYKSSKIALLVDENTATHCLPLVMPILKDRDYYLMYIDSGERNKNIQTSKKLWQRLIDLKFDRNSLLIVLGGGVLCDIGGFIATTYKRGIDMIYIPTTLLAQTDAAWGGKNGINFSNYKNQIGTINLPSLIAVNTDFLQTLPNREFSSGLAEIIKHGIIGDKSILEDMNNNQQLSHNNIMSILKKSIQVKINIVSTDFEDKGERKKLNFGHTVGHAIESVYEEKYNHGECVAFGMLTSLYLSKQLLGLNEDTYEYCCNIIRKNITIPKIYAEEFPSIINKMYQDKKNYNGEINFVLLKSIDEPVINIPVDENLILEALLHNI
ncbi:3-dehydroquinate synthase [Bacteroidales bacterium OttesenSCG-928-K22]|nr:3-dehydroquinate synthase [Bacteroidales bacterium OttesenSCG-928-K22]